MDGGTEVFIANDWLLSLVQQLFDKRIENWSDGRQNMLDMGKSCLNLKEQTADNHRPFGRCGSLAWLVKFI